MLSRSLLIAMPRNVAKKYGGDSMEYIKFALMINAYLHRRGVSDETLTDFYKKLIDNRNRK